MVRAQPVKTGTGRRVRNFWQEMKSSTGWRSRQKRNRHQLPKMVHRDRGQRRGTKRRIRNREWKTDQTMALKSETMRSFLYCEKLIVPHMMILTAQQYHRSVLQLPKTLNKRDSIILYTTLLIPQMRRIGVVGRKPEQPLKCMTGTSALRPPGLLLRSLDPRHLADRRTFRGAAILLTTVLRNVQGVLCARGTALWAHWGQTNNERYSTILNAHGTLRNFTCSVAV